MEDPSQENTSENTDAALPAERIVCHESGMYSSLWDGRTSDTAKQILAVKFEDGSEYSTKDGPKETEHQLISARDIKLLDIEIRDRERVRNILTELEDMWRG